MTITAAEKKALLGAKGAEKAKELFTSRTPELIVDYDTCEEFFEIMRKWDKLAASGEETFKATDLQEIIPSIKRLSQLVYGDELAGQVLRKHWDGNLMTWMSSVML